MSNIKDVFSNIYTNYGFGGSESRSGPGSTLAETDGIRQEIRKLVHDKNIKTVVDIPCGDFNWMKEIVYGFEKYIGGDIVSDAIRDNQKYANQIISFIEFDLTDDTEIPEADLLIVRDVIGHLPLEKGKKAINKILNSKCKYLLSTTWYKNDDVTYHKTHQNRDVEPGRFYPVCLCSEPFNLPYPEFYIEEQPIVDGYDSGVRKGLGFWNLQKLRGEKPTMEENVTIVTGLWDLGRGDISVDFKRGYDHYKQKFAELLKTPNNMFIYVSKADEAFVWEHRSRKNTVVKVMELDEFDTWFEFFGKVQDIRNKPEWSAQAGWLQESPQANLKYYNPVVMTKMFMVNDVTLINPFDSKYFFWIDAGITNTVHSGYFYYDKVFDNLPKYIDAIDKFLFLSYGYNGANEIHGFERKAMARYAETDYVKYVCRGGFFGGKKEHINVVNGKYYNILKNTLTDGFMGTEENIFTILAHIYSEQIHRFEIENDGLIWPFFEALKNIETLIKQVPPKKVIVKNAKSSIYILGYNSPTQFKSVAESIKLADETMFTNTRKILINNTLDTSLFEEYDKLCTEFAFEEIHKDNIGICGGRQFVAEHFDQSDTDFYLFFEDDMLLNSQEMMGKTCRNGFSMYIPNLYEKLTKIMVKENFDFLKLSFSEFYGDNSVQWSWYNVPQTIRTEFWPDYDKLPAQGLDPNAPKTLFKNINIIDNLPYITGEIYYSNWPQIVSRNGNKKMFLDTKWDNPFEQTWMSYMFQETLKGNIRPAVLLASPINHNRISHYKPEERREN